MLYRLNTERKYIDGTDKKVRQWTYGQRDRNKLNKVVLMVGQTGTGKTTIINTMVNYLLGVKFEDQEFYYITEENEDKDQSQSQTNDITVYEVFVEENPTSLTIIDTPGYADTEGYEKDRELSESLIRLFSDEDGIHYIDAVCFVMKASDNRLSEKEFYIFHSVLSLFGRDIGDNIVFLLTYSSGCPPEDALNAIKKAEIPCRRDENNEPVYFLFNNQQKVQRDQKYKRALKSAWEMGEESINELFTLLDEKNRKRVQMTLNVLKERRQLEACVSNLVDKISEKELKTNELNGIQEALRQNRDKIGNCENFEFTVQRAVREKVSIENEWWWNSKATCCSICEENCHEWHCSWAKDPSTCWVMKNNHCTVCTKKCHHEKHVKEGKKYVTNIKEVIMTFDELKKEYEDTEETTVKAFDKAIFENTKKSHESNVKDSTNKTEIEQKIINDLEEIKIEKSKLLNEAYVSITRLSEIALKADSAFTLQHVDFLILRLKEEGKDEWMKNLEDMKKAGEQKKNKGAVDYLMAFGKHEWMKNLEDMKKAGEQKKNKGAVDYLMAFGKRFFWG
uniref:AIG1-type G domain-containing protein n=1 Tax=Cyprinus carpio TaxID=7962 RepID=A0A8C1TQM2_CYPCA